MRLQADELTVYHHNQLVTVSEDSGESITMWLTRVTPGDDGTVVLRGRALGQSRGVVLAGHDTVHVYADDEAGPTAVAEAVGVLTRAVHRTVRPRGLGRA